MANKINGETIDILMGAFGLELKDLPAFPPKKLNLTGFIVAVGMKKIKSAIKEDIMEIVTKRKSIKKEIINYLKTI